MIYASWDTTLCINDTKFLIEELKKVGSSRELNIVVLLDTMYPKDETNFLYILKNTTRNIPWYEKDSNLGDWRTLAEFIDRVKKNFTAQHYILIIASPHGMAWQGVCQDNDINKGRTQAQLEATFIDMSELTTALKRITNNGRERIDIIGFSTCITASVEVAYQIAPYANYMVASEENMQSFSSNPNYTWPHYKSLSKLREFPNMSAEDFAKCIVNNFVAESNTSAYLRCYPTKKWVNIPINTTLSAINLSRVSQVASAVDKLAMNLIKEMPKYRDIIKEARSKARKFGPWYPRTKFGYLAYLPKIRETMTKMGIPYFMDVWIDLYHFSELLYNFLDQNNESPKLKFLLQKVMEAINNSVIANNVSTGDNAHGMHVYFPSNAFRYDQHLWWIGFPYLLLSKKAFASYEKLDFAKATSWNEMLYRYYHIPDFLVKPWLKLKRIF